MKPEKLFDETWTGGQDVGYTGVWKFGKTRIRIRIRVDSYASQSYALAEALDSKEIQWHVIDSLPYQQIRGTRELKFNSRDWYIANFQQDVNKLLGRVGKLLTGVIQ